MKLPEVQDNEPKRSKTVLHGIAGVVLFLVFVLALVLVMNLSGGNEKKPPVSAQESESGYDRFTEEEEGFSGSSGSVLSPDDLDFWDMYPIKSTEKEEGKEEVKEEENDPSTDGKHTKVVNADGEEEWLLINQYLTKNSYDLTKLVNQSGRMKYYVNGKQTSYVGVDICEEQSYVDFAKLKEAGVDFVMLRVGARRYSSGQIMADAYFEDNIAAAIEAGLDVGVYFFSQAITEKEAEKEAKYVLQHIKGYALTYPVVFQMSYIVNDSSRIDSLTVEEKTNIAVKFLETVKKAGYVPMIQGTKEWLLQQIDLTRLNEYDIWLSQVGDLPDYPYKFSMWQYSNSGTVDGISGKVNMNISFIDYSEK